MIDLSTEALTYLLIALAIGAIVGFLLMRRRQTVRLSDRGPVRPYMSNTLDSRREGNDLVSQASAATTDVTGEIIGVRAHAQLGANDGGGDDFQRMKGVGPRLAEALHAHGFNRFEQLAHLTPEEVERVDADLGAFRGRLARDRIVEQAHYLARGDQDGFEEKFGKL